MAATTIKFIHKGVSHDILVWYSTYLKKWCWSASGKEDKADTQDEAVELARRWIRDGQ